MAEIRQAVDDRDGAKFCEILHFLLREGTDHNTVKVAGQHAGGILNRLSTADL